MVSVHGLQEEDAAIFEAFKGFFEDEAIKKVWHNYSFDRHVFQRMVRGLCNVSAHLLRFTQHVCKGSGMTARLLEFLPVHYQHSQQQ